eukprot:scaffold14035_cov172-Amphora_coffeaeformis.AAC.2
MSSSLDPFPLPSVAPFSTFSCTAEGNMDETTRRAAFFTPHRLCRRQPPFTAMHPPPGTHCAVGHPTLDDLLVETRRGCHLELGRHRRPLSTVGPQPARASVPHHGAPSQKVVDIHGWKTLRIG